MLEPDLFAIFFYRAPTAPGRNRDAEVLAKRDEQIIVGLPVVFRELFPEREFGFIGGFRLHIAPNVGDSVDMGIDTDPLLVMSDGHHEIRGFSTDPCEGQELFECTRYMPMIFFYQEITDFQEIFCLGPVKTDWVNEPLDLGRREFQHRLRCRGPRKETFARRFGHGILGSEREQATDECSERTIPGLGGDHPDRRDLPFLDLLSQDIENFLEGLSCHKVWLA